MTLPFMSSSSPPGTGVDLGVGLDRVDEALVAAVTRRHRTVQRRDDATGDRRVQAERRRAAITPSPTTTSFDAPNCSGGMSVASIFSTARSEDASDPAILAGRVLPLLSSTVMVPEAATRRRDVVVGEDVALVVDDEAGPGPVAVGGRDPDGDHARQRVGGDLGDAAVRPGRRPRTRRRDRRPETGGRFGGCWPPRTTAPPMRAATRATAAIDSHDRERSVCGDPDGRASVCGPPGPEAASCPRPTGRRSAAEARPAHTGHRWAPGAATVGLAARWNGTTRSRRCRVSSTTAGTPRAGPPGWRRCRSAGSSRRAAAHAWPACRAAAPVHHRGGREAVPRGRVGLRPPLAALLGSGVGHEVFLTGPGARAPVAVERRTGRIP